MILGIRYLTGYCVAQDLTHQQPEWPPHPARVFMAMAASHFETGADAGERDALLWLERQPPPQMLASPAEPRSAVETYVPVNDQSGGIIRRPRQSRSFPTVRPDSDLVYLRWNHDPDAVIRAALGRLCQKVTRIGHSSSLAQMWVPDEAESVGPNWHPDETNSHLRLRVPSSGLLQYLGQSFNGEAIEGYGRLLEQLALAKGKAKAALSSEMKERFRNERPEAAKPTVNTWCGYRNLEPLATSNKSANLLSPFDSDFIVLVKSEGSVLGLESTLQVTLAMRDALLKACPQPQPEWLTGHAPDKSPSKHPHVACFPLPFVGTTHADGHVMGVGVAIPRQLVGETREREQVLRECIGPLFFNPLKGTKRNLTLWKTRSNTEGKAWEWKMERELREDPPRSLKTATWTGPSDCWASVTPVVLHHYPKKGKTQDVERILRDAFRSALLPEPKSLQLSIASAHLGAGSLRDVPAFTERGGPARYGTHVVATFDQRVTGPMLVGRGRFRGYGLFRPFFRKEDKW